MARQDFQDEKILGRTMELPEREQDLQEDR